jgi:vanillate O-demethylase monooxygenase subunit
MSYLNNVWYCAALSEEITTTPIRRVICDEPLAIFRTESGRVAALEDRCSHRQAPLSRGLVVGEEIQCQYHGFVFDCAGGCTFVPQQTTAPRNASIKSWTLVEQWGYLWLWWGDQTLADPSRIPNLPRTRDEGFRTVYLHFSPQCNQQLMADNLLDLSHVDFLHRHGIGSKAGAKNQADSPQIDIECHTDGENVYYTRKVNNTTLGGTAAKWANSQLPVDRVSKQMWEKPNTVHIDLSMKNEETDILISMAHIITPETLTSSHYFMHWARDFGLDNVNYPTDEDVWAEQNGVVSGEDIPMVEAQQRNILEFNSEFDVAAKQDMFIGNVHKLLQELYNRDGMKFPPEITRTVRARVVNAS